MNKIKNPETILDKWYKPRMHWKKFNRGQVIRAMEEYHDQFKGKVTQREVSDMADKIVKVIRNNTKDNIKESVINGINFLLSKSQPDISEADEKKYTATLFSGEREI